MIKFRSSYAVITNNAIWLVLPDSRNFTRVHSARQTRPLISTPLARAPIQRAGCARL